MNVVLLAVFMAFSLGVSWVSGAKEQDRLADDVKQAHIEKGIMHEQVGQATARASRDAKRMNKLTSQVRKLSTAKTKAEKNLEKEKRRRASLLRIQLAALKRKVGTRYEEQLNDLEYKLSDSEVRIEELTEEKRNIIRRYNQLIKEGVEGGELMEMPKEFRAEPKKKPKKKAPVYKDITPTTAPREQKTGGVWEGTPQPKKEFKRIVVPSKAKPAPVLKSVPVEVTPAPPSIPKTEPAPKLKPTPKAKPTTKAKPKKVAPKPAPKAPAKPAPKPAPKKGLTKAEDNFNKEFENFEESISEAELNKLESDFEKEFKRYEEGL